MVFFLLLVGAYDLLVRRPMAAVLERRLSLTSGAMEQARGAIGAAESQTALYETKLREAKAEIYRLRDQRLKQWAIEREALLQQARTETQAKVQQARLEIEGSAAAARKQIEGMSEDLSAHVLRAVLPASVMGAAQ